MSSPGSQERVDEVVDDLCRQINNLHYAHLQILATVDLDEAKRWSRAALAHRIVVDINERYPKAPA